MWGELRCDQGKYHLLLWIVGRIAEEAWEDTSPHPIREFDYNALSICLLKFPCENEFEDSVNQFPVTVRDDIRRG